MLPMYHSGMGDVQPRGSTVPRVGKRVTVTVGEPVDLRDVTCRCNVTGENQQQVSGGGSNVQRKSCFCIGSATTGAGQQLLLQHCQQLCQ